MAGILATIRRSSTTNGVVRPFAAALSITPSSLTTKATTRVGGMTTNLFSTKATATTTTSTTTTPFVIPRVKTCDATEPSEGRPIMIKGWVKTVRKQKTLAFVEVNDGSNLGGIQCVLSFDAIDDETKEGA